jgi:predicted exporter
MGFKIEEYYSTIVVLSFPLLCSFSVYALIPDLKRDFHALSIASVVGTIIILMQDLYRSSRIFTPQSLFLLTRKRVCTYLVTVFLFFKQHRHLSILCLW